MGGFMPDIRLKKTGDNISVLVRQRYMARGVKEAFRWRYAGYYSLKELKEEEREVVGGKG